MGRQTKNLQKCSQVNMRQIDDGVYEMSLYEGVLTTECMISEIKKLKKAFPGLPVEFYDLLTDRITELRFVDKRLVSSVNNVIDNCVYPMPTIANFINYDKKFKLYSYEAMCKLAIEWGPGVWKRHEKININNTIYWKEQTEI